MSIGTRRSVTGLCNVEVVEPEELPFENLARDREHVLMLLSDAIVPGPQGGYLRGLDDDALSRVLGCDVTVLAAYSSWHTVGAWSGVWGKPRESAIAIEAGSVWLVEADSDCLESCAQEGIGVRRFEGYGWVELDPDYIEEGETNGIWKLESCIGEASQAEDLKQTSEHWPGLEQVVLGNLEAILETVGNGQTPKDSAEVKRQITALTREANPDPCELFRLHVLLEQSKSKEW